MKITIEDINRRQRLKRDSFPYTVKIGEPRIYTENNIFCKNNAIDALHNWDKLSENTNMAFDKALDIFEEMCLNMPESNINTECAFLIEAVEKVRDAEQLQSSISHRLSRYKTRITTKVEKKTEKTNNALKTVIGNITSTLSKAGVVSSNDGVASSQPSSNDNKTDDTETKEEQVLNTYFGKIADKVKFIKECDRIIDNYNKVSKRFNLDKLVCEMAIKDPYQCMYDIAAMIDTYNIPFRNKYSSALENAYYVLNKHFINFAPEAIVEACTDYFIFNTEITKEYAVDMDKVKRSSVLFEEKDFCRVDPIINGVLKKDDSPVVDDASLWSMNQDSSSIDYMDPENYNISAFGCIAEADLKKFAEKSKRKLNKTKRKVLKDTKYAKKTIIKDVKYGNPEEQKDEEIKKMVDEFRLNCAKEPDKNKNIFNLKGLITKIYTKSAYQMVHELPSIFSIIRASFIISVTAINPLLGLIGFITDQFIKLHLTRKHMEKVLNAYKNEINAIDVKIEKCKNEEEKERYTKYRSKLKDDYDKLKSENMENYTDDENDERGAWDDDIDGEKYDFNFDLDDDEFDLGDDDEFDTEFEESALQNAASVILAGNIIDSISETVIDNNIDGIVCDNIFKLDNDTMDMVTNFVVTVPVLHEKETLKEAMIDYREDIRNKPSKTAADYIRIDCINDNIAKLNESNTIYFNTNINASLYYLYCINELAKMSSDNYITEMEFTNTLKLAVNNLKRGAIKLSTKEKQVSGNLDAAVETIRKSMERAVSNGNREAVIKGSIIPSFSKCIKWALGIGAVWVINPVVAVIGAIGAFACAKHMQNKERQLVLDDIEIELKMCERYINQADNENNLKKVRELEKIQRNLERQKQRIKYKMNVEHDQRVPNSTAKPGDDD